MMNDGPLISIIVPVYNLEKYIGLCLNTLINQNVDKSKYEVICINDGSTDNSENIILEYAKKYDNIILINKENGGVSSARNVGLDNAQGEWICFLDGDDLYLPNSLDKVLLKLNDEYDMYQFGYIKIEDNFEALYNDYNIENYVFGYSKDLLWDKVYKKSIIDRYNIRFSNKMTFGEDICFVLNYLRFVKNDHKIDNLIYLYRQRETSAMHIKNIARYKKQIDSLYQLCLTINNEFLPTIEKKSKLYKFEKNKLSEESALAFYLSPLSGIDKKEMVKKFKENKMYPFAISWEQINEMKSIKYKIKCFFVYMLRFRLVYYIFYDIVKFVLRKKLK